MVHEKAAFETGSDRLRLSHLQPSRNPYLRYRDILPFRLFLTLTDPYSKGSTKA